MRRHAPAAPLLAALLVLAGLSGAAAQPPIATNTKADPAAVPTLEPFVPLPSNSGLPPDTGKPPPDMLAAGAGQQPMPISGPAPGGKPPIAAADVKAKNTAAACWTIMDGQVYDLTAWLPIHPGALPPVAAAACASAAWALLAAASARHTVCDCMRAAHFRAALAALVPAGGQDILLSSCCGQDCTTSFKRMHPAGSPLTIRQQYAIGPLATAAQPSAVPAQPLPAVEAPPIVEEAPAAKPVEEAAPLVEEAPLPVQPVPVPSGDITQADVEARNTADDCWTIMDGQVYDITPWLPIHPGEPARRASMHACT